MAKKKDTAKKKDKAKGGRSRRSQRAAARDTSEVAVLADGDAEALEAKARKQARRRPAARTDRQPPGEMPKLGRKEFEKEMRKLQEELVKLQRWAQATRARIIVLFEGRDTAGKGGVIKRITERTSPRVFRVVALPAPTEREKSQMYIQRYMEHFPAGGEIVLFDRSWYNRAGVDRVMGFATEKQVKTFLRGIPSVEKAITASGIILIKYWLDVTMENQTKRIKERIDDYVKIWKLSPMDLESYSKWYEYSRARDEMFAATDTDINPWFVVDSNDQRRGRLNCIAHLLSQIPYHDVPQKKIKLPDRQSKGRYVEPDYPYRYVPARY